MPTALPARTLARASSQESDRFRYDAAERSHMRRLYGRLYVEAVTVAHRHGYHLALHGSMERDLDVVAVPWQRRVSTPQALVEDMAASLGGRIDPRHAPDVKTHGRLAWIIRFGGGAHLDFSVTPKG